MGYINMTPIKYIPPFFFNVLRFTLDGEDRWHSPSTSFYPIYSFYPLTGEGRLSPAQFPLPLFCQAQGQDGPGPHPVVDVLVDRICALVEGALEEQGAHGNGEGESRSSTKQQGVQSRNSSRTSHVSSLPNSSHCACAEVDYTLQMHLCAMPYGNGSLLGSQKSSS